MRLSALAWAGLAASSLAAAEPTWQLEAGAGAQTLGGGRGHWSQQDLALRAREVGGAAGSIEWRRVDRFGRVDQELGLQVRASPLPGWWAGIRVTRSPEHQMLPRRALRLELQRQPAAGWLVDAALQQSRHDAARVDSASLGVEAYRAAGGDADWRFAARISVGRIDNTRGSSLQLQIDRIGGDGSRLGLIVADGRESETDAAGSAFLVRQTTAALVARWPLGGRWALVGDLGATRVASTYWRRGGRLGVQLDL